ncbi:MAG: hypothetical protein ATN32_10105 [Candidatus Epulonipiscium fishelsonii]|nr:MAG: hypothetical protein ATN32_10105 [Epulopiscium sp. AS2M-Bin002]
MIKIFFKDVFDKKYIIYSIIINLILILNPLLAMKDSHFIISETTKFYFHLGSTILLVVIGYNIVTQYVKQDKTIFYYSLPFSANRLNLAMLITFFVQMLIMTGIGIFALLYIYNYPKIIYFIYIISMINSVMLAMVLCQRNLSFATKSILSGWFFLSLVVLFLSLYKFNNYNTMSEINFLIVGIILLGIICFSKNPIMNIASKTSINTTIVDNYFIKYMLSNKMYFINIIVMVGVGIFCALELPPEINMPLGCFIVAANSPLLTIFSIEKSLLDFDKMLPSKYLNLSHLYFELLFVYFSIANFVIITLATKTISFKNVIIVAFISMVEAKLGQYLEKKYPIKAKTADQVWGHPRKYLFCLIMFLLAFTINYLAL